MLKISYLAVASCLALLIALDSFFGTAEARCYTQRQCMTKTNSVPQWGFRCTNYGRYRSCARVIVGYQRVYAGQTCWGVRTVCR